MSLWIPRTIGRPFLGRDRATSDPSCLMGQLALYERAGVLPVPFCASHRHTQVGVCAPRRTTRTATSLIGFCLGGSSLDSISLLGVTLGSSSSHFFIFGASAVAPLIPVRSMPEETALTGRRRQDDDVALVTSPRSTSCLWLEEPVTKGSSSHHEELLGVKASSISLSELLEQLPAVIRASEGAPSSSTDPIGRLLEYVLSACLHSGWLE